MIILQGLSPKRAQLLARLAAERSHLYLQLEGLDDEHLSGLPAVGNWTAAALLADTANSEKIAADNLSRLANNRDTEIRPSIDEAPPEPRDTTSPHPFAGISFDEAIAIAQKERRNFLATLDRLEDEDLLRRVRSRSGRRIRPGKWATRPYRRDAQISADLARWRATLPLPDPALRTIHSALLRPILTLSRNEFLALASLIPPDDRESRPLEGIWTLKQMIGHLVDYEGLGIVALSAVAAGMEPDY
ncbi:MAG: DinB family protein, partial [Anaerolineae bacterium]|nr:DinB family protein [Anaerolineae bacterium]